jgi:hypothetical protein
MSYLFRRLHRDRWIISSAIILIGVALVVYRNALNIGFYSDDYMFVDWAVRRDLPEYLRYYFDPQLQWLWYRPMQGVGFGLGYLFFGVDALGFHVVQLALHILNTLLLFGLTMHLSRKWYLGFLAAFLYTTLPTFSLAVQWATVADPLVAVFYLLAIVFWVRYLETDSRVQWLLTIVAMAFALLTKEAAATLPVTLFLIDRWVVARSASLSALIKRYAIFALVILVYVSLIFKVVTQGNFTHGAGYGLSSRVITVALEYLTLLAWPWGLPAPWNYIWLAVVVSGLGYFAFKREWRILLIGILAILLQSPVMMFRVVFVRYTYLPLMATSIGMALGIVALVRQRFARVSFFIAALLIVLVTWLNSIQINQSALALAGVARETRLQLRPVFQRHPNLPGNSYFYFIDLPLPTINLSGLVAQRYGPNVTISGIDFGAPANFRDRYPSFAIYQNEQGVWQDQPVDWNARVIVTPGLPAKFGDVVMLTQFEVANTQAKRGEAIILTMHWMTTLPLTREYTVFAHLVDAQGKLIAGYDGPPMRGVAPTSKWVPNTMIVDPIVIPIDADATVGTDNRVEIGMYDAMTGERLPLLNATRQVVGDAVVFDSFTITP